MKKSIILDIFKKTGAFIEGHFLLSSGLHSGQYLQCAIILQYPEYAKKICRDLAGLFKKEKPTAVIAPAIGGILVSYEVANILGCRSLFTEREDNKMVLRRGFSLKKTDRVLVVEDVITTGTSTREVIEVVKKEGAKLVGVGAIVDRSFEETDFGTEFKSLVKLDIKTFTPVACPMCKKGIPAVKPGSKKL